MDLRLTGEQEQLVDTFAALYRRESTPERVRASEPLGFDKALWEHLRELGVVAMAVSDQAGGWGASLLDLALIAEQQGRAVAPVPVIEAQVAARLLEAVGFEDLAPVVAGDRLVTLALAPPTNGIASLVPAGAVADAVTTLIGDEVGLLGLDDQRRTRVDNLGSMPVADVVADGGTMLASGPAAVAAFDRAVDEFALLTAAAVVGVGARALEITTEYVRERHAWGQPIGGFQGVSHRLADAATAIDGARLLVYEAAWAADAKPARFEELASMAFAFASEAARDTTYWAVHLHGGYGFMLEYDVQLYYRRARAWPRVYQSPAGAYRRVADRRYGGA